MSEQIVEMTEDEIIDLIVKRAVLWELGSWLAPANPAIAEALWGIAHDIECEDGRCEDSTVGHLAEYRQRRLDSPSGDVR